MYYDALFLNTSAKPSLCTRAEVWRGLRTRFRHHCVSHIYAYNICFDQNHLLKLHSFDCSDIMFLVAYHQHNTKIHADAECFSTDKSKRGHSVEPILRLLSGNHTYRETHNVLLDAVYEFEIMKLPQINLVKNISL